jgi:hypothetical protein
MIIIAGKRKKCKFLLQSLKKPTQNRIPGGLFAAVQYSPQSNRYSVTGARSAGASFLGVLTRLLTGCAAIIPAGQGLSSAFNFVVAWLPGSSHAASEIQFSSDLPLLFVAGPR